MSTMKKLRDKNGIVFYFDETTNKQASDKQGRKQYVKENVDLITRGIVPYESLSREEKLSYQAQKRFRLNNELLSKTEELVLKRYAKDFNIKIPSAGEVKNAFPEGAFPTGSIEDIAKGFSQNFFRQEGEVKNNIMFSMVRNMTRALESGDKVKVITEEGEELDGAEAIEYISFYIADTMQEAEEKKSDSPIINFKEQITADDDGSFLHTVDMAKTYKEFK